MATEKAKIDGNRHKTILLEKDDGSGELVNAQADAITKRLKVAAVITSPFTSLSDTPAAYTGEAGKTVVVNGAADGLEFAAGGAGDVTAAAALTANMPVVGDDGAKGVKTANAALDFNAQNVTNVGTVDGRDVSTDGSKLDGVEALADVTDEANVKSSLNGATITAATVATDDKVLIQDTDDADNLKTVTAQSIADLAGGGTGLFDTSVMTFTDTLRADELDINVTNTGTVAQITDTSGIALSTGGTASSRAFVAGYQTNSAHMLSAGYAKDMKVRMMVDVDGFNTSTQVLIYGIADSSDPSAATQFAGIQIVTVGTDKVFAASKDGATTETTDITADWGTINARKVIDVVYTAGTDVKFYLNGALVATHTTRIPDNTDTTSSVRPVAYGVRNLGTTSDTTMKAGWFVLEQEI